MGFYGNITNTSRTQFQFDRIYSSRVEMDTNKFNDGIYAGRYVLVEYDQVANLQLDTFLRVYFNQDQAFTSPNFEANTLVTVGLMKNRENQFVYTAGTTKDPSAGLAPKECEFFVRIEEENELETTPAKFKSVVQSESNYTINYKLDTEKYGEGRGYDSTVWMKMYVDNIEKYVMIAELNTVVPTFEVSADAPTMAPITPHFDTASTDVYYKLHYQPQWGFRLKANEQTLEDEDGKKIYSIDAAEYPSDLKVEHKWATYDPTSGKQDIHTMEYDSAVYYNKAGFNPAVRSYYEGYDNEISILPTGQSGNLYNDHKGDASTSAQPDIQELKILLPAIGNMVSDAWDIVYGYNSDNENRRYRDIEWKDCVTGEDNEELGGMTRNLETLAGCINYTHDLMGMIITDKKDEYLIDNTWYNKNYIYKEENKYYRICEYPVYTVTNEIFTLPEAKESDQEYNTAYNLLLNNFEHPNYYITDDNGNYILVNKNAIPNLIANNIPVYYNSGVAYKYIEMPEFADNLTTINGLLLELRRVLNTEEIEVRDFNTIQGIKNSLNDIINIFDKLIPGQFVIVDKNGNIESANWTTAQEFNYINYGTNEITNGETKENRWIKVDLDEDTNLISIKHQYNPVDEDLNTTTYINLNEDQENLSENSYDNIELYTPIVDNMGHIIGKNLHTITLPYGYKIIKIGNSNAVTEAEMDVIEDQRADNTQDTLSLIASNKWIKLDNADEDTIKFGHKISDFVEGTKPNTLYGLTQNEDHTSNLNEDNKFEVPCLSFDEAGHITEARTHTVTLPENYDKVEVVISPENFQNEKLTEGTAASIVADSMTDTLTFKQGNKWALLTGNANDDSITFSHYVDKFNQTENSTDFNNTDSGKVFYTQEIAWDEAGHLISSNKHNFTLPDNFKNISITNSGSANTAINNSAANGILIADTLVDTATIDAGNRWIQLAADVDNDKVTIYHAPASAPPSGNTTFDDAETPNYGVAFTIPEVKYDEAGHIYSVDTHTVKFPTPSLNSDLDATGSSVLTGFKLMPETLAITQTNADVGTLKLKGYTQADETDKISADDTINGAINKLAQRIKNHEDELNTLVGEGKLKESFDTLVEMSEWLDANDTELRQTLVDADNALNKKIDDEIAARETKDEAIDAAAVELSGKVDLEIAERKNNDSTHAAGIKDNADAIKAIELVLEDTFNPDTLFDWGYERKENPGAETEIIDGDPVLDEKGNPTYDDEGNQIFEQIEQVKNFVTISYEPYQATLQDILNEILEYHKDLRAIGNDNGDKIYKD